MDAAFQVAVIGGGIVGVATARALTERGVDSLVVLEAEPELAAHQSGHNSGVIHSGLYYRPGSLKARNCVAGREAMYSFCEEEGIAVRRSGKLVVATQPTEIPALDELERRGRVNGLHGLQRLDPAELVEREPAVSGIAGLWVPETGMVDYRVVTVALAQRARENGATIWTGARVLAVRPDGADTVLETSRGEVRVQFLINCAGLHSDRVARMCGVNPGIRIVPFRGEYYELVPERRDLVRTAIYPVPDPRLPFLGVHFTRTVDDRVDAGPNAVLAWKREGYARNQISVRDLAETLGYSGFWRMAGKHWRAGAAEMLRSFNKARFVRDLQRLVPDVRSEDLVPGKSGVRAQAVDHAGKLLDDFHLMHAPRSVHLLNAPSPAATSAISIGRMLAERVKGAFAHR